MNALYKTEWHGTLKGTLTCFCFRHQTTGLLSAFGSWKMSGSISVAGDDVGGEGTAIVIMCGTSN